MQEPDNSGIIAGDDVYEYSVGAFNVIVSVETKVP